MDSVRVFALQMAMEIMRDSTTDVSLVIKEAEKIENWLRGNNVTNWLRGNNVTNS